MSEGGPDGDGGGGAEVVGVESNANAVVDGKNQFFISLPPVLNHRYVGRRLSRQR